MLFSLLCSDPCSVSAASTSSHPPIHAPGSVCTHHTHHVSTRIGIGISLRLFKFLHDLVAFSHLRHATSTIFPARSTPPPLSAEFPPGQPRCPCYPCAQQNPTVRPTHRCHCVPMQLGPFWDTSAVGSCRPSSCIPAVSLVAIGATALCCRIPSLSTAPRFLSFTSPPFPYVRASYTPFPLTLSRSPTDDASSRVPI
ncbi:hypothetical protein BD413DRAFT_592380 [Trametes elegans]|nr:hypothetical protein BD413DRAFT_592380 [Trametes elegans]